MSVELLTMVLTIAGLLITLGGGMFAGFSWMLRRTDEHFGAIRKELQEEFRGSLGTLSKEMRDEFRSAHKDLRQIHGEVTEIKISVARLEGPRERLILPHGTTSAREQSQ